MSVTRHDTYPKLPWWRRALLRLAGNDLVAVVATQMMPDGTTHTQTLWLTGVDMRTPMAVEHETGVTVAIEALPSPEDG